MSSSNIAVIVDSNTGQPLMVVVPDTDSQLSDPSFNPPNTKQILVPAKTYRISTHGQLSAIIDSVVKEATASSEGGVNI